MQNKWIKKVQCYNLKQESWLQVAGRSIVVKVDYYCLKLEE